MDIESPPPPPPASRPAATGSYEYLDSVAMAGSFTHTPATQGSVSTMASRSPLVLAPNAISPTVASKPKIIQVAANQWTPASAHHWNENAPQASGILVFADTSPRMKNKRVDSTSSNAELRGHSFE